MKIIHIISEHKKRHGHRAYNLFGAEVGTLGQKRGENWTPAPRGMKRVQAVVEVFGIVCTKHINVPVS